MKNKRGKVRRTFVPDTNDGAWGSRGLRAFPTGGGGLVKLLQPVQDIQSLIYDLKTKAKKHIERDLGTNIGPPARNMAGGRPRTTLSGTASVPSAMSSMAPRAAVSSEERIGKWTLL
jgi:hypothetical protein